MMLSVALFVIIVLLSIGVYVGNKALKEYETKQRSQK